ncbi:hypothetical protein DIPPA_18221 [Diplonema papillatum]|nr:hypothetical protein DIPPA_18221 [Diplonema papillatum]
MAPRIMLLVWIPVATLLLIVFTSYAYDEDQPAAVCACGHGTNTGGKDCICKCFDGWSGARCTVKEIKNVHTQAQHMNSAENLQTPEPPPPVIVRSGMTESERVLHDLPYLQYTEEGEAASQKANDVWRARVEAAYGGSTEEIGGREGIHLFFTTDCSKHSLWQALTLEYTWAKVRQPGALTRIVSGCFGQTGVPSANTELMKRFTLTHKKFFIFFGPKVGGATANRKHITCGATESGWYEGDLIKEEDKANGVDDCKHFCRDTPKCVSYNYRHHDKMCHLFSQRTERHDVDDHSTGTCTGVTEETADKYKMPDYIADYSPMNRPTTAMYWFNNAKPLERVLGLLDPDMVFTRPLMFHIEGDGLIVEKGRPVGQYYDYLVSQDWHKHYKKICPEPICGPLGNKKDFAPGPPHLMHRLDWEELAPWWVRYTVGARKWWGQWTSEMAGMSIGMARLGLRSRLFDNGMWDRVSEAGRVMRELKIYHGGFDTQDSRKLCAEENENCKVPDDSNYIVFYGADGQYRQKPARGQTIRCHHKSSDLGAAFFDGEGDPAPGKRKECLLEMQGGEVHPAATSLTGGPATNWVYCAEEKARCLVPPGEKFSVRYGWSPTEQYIEKTDIAGMSVIHCLISQGDPTAFDADPASGKHKQCFYKKMTGSLPPPTLTEYIPQDKLPSLFHYCFTFEVQQRLWEESFWKREKLQKKWEVDNQQPLLRYIHWSKYRSLTDWPGNARAKTLLDCDQPLLFEFPPLPVMLANYSRSNEDKGWVFHMAIVLPSINAAVTNYKLHYCKDTPINLKRQVRTAHNTWWISDYEIVIDPTADNGYKYIIAGSE